MTGVLLLLSNQWKHSHSSKLVRVSYTMLSDGQYRTMVWGGDDDGMEIDLPTEHEALNKFLEIINLQYVNKDKLKVMELYRA